MSEIRWERSLIVRMTWINSDGVETWETIWGSSNGTTPYDWEPHTTDVIQNNVYASRWPLWTLVS